MTLLTELLAKAGVSPVRLSGDASIARATLDSRRADGETLFVARTGAAADGESYLDNPSPAAIVHSEAGFDRAVALGKAVALIPMPRRPDAEWRLMDTLYEHPTRAMKVIGVTGTNGKTSVCWFLRDMLTAFGLRAGYLGTLGFQCPGVERELSNTTPFAVELYGMLAEARDAGVEALAMEVSSHALAEKRCDGVEFDVGVFLNLTQDHLDLHGTMEAYKAAKMRLFKELPALSEKRFTAAVNLGDPAGENFQLPGGVAYALVAEETEDGYDGCLTGLPTRIGLTSIEMELGALGLCDGTVKASVGGGYNAENVLSACAALYALAESTDLFQGDRSQTKLELLAGLASAIRPVPGRFEPVPSTRDLDVVVDYAHTPDAVEKLLAAVRPLARGKIHVMLGCGGDRDRAKRPLMARAAVEGADRVILTSDNPRTEDPEAILDDMTAGLRAGKYERIADRAEAIRAAISGAAPGDAVVIAGKGHETYQIVGRTKHPFDDRMVAREALA